MAEVYMDHAATTALRPQALEAMLPHLQANFGNPSSLYSRGRDARRLLDQAKERIAFQLGAEMQDIVLTSGGSEANNLAVKGMALAGREEGLGNRVVVSCIEHHSVLDAARSLVDLGFEVTELPVDSRGRVSPDVLAEAITPGTVLVSIMHANNEVGTVQPLAELAAVADSHGVPFHTDAVQTVGVFPVRPLEMGISLLSMSAHKFGGPKGVGALYARRGMKLVPLIHGGGQERNRRAGTENVAGAVGMAAAFELAAAERGEAVPRIESLRDRLIERLLAEVPGAVLNGDRMNRLPGNANLRFDEVDGESLVLSLDMEGISVSSGSACTSGSMEPSHVLLGMGQTEQEAKEAVRFSLGVENERREVDQVVTAVARAVQRIRSVGALPAISAGVE